MKLRATAATGYGFRRWKNGNTSVYTNANPLSFKATENVTYTAYFTNIKWKVTYEKGSYGTGGSSSAIKTYGTALTLPSALFTRAGYTQTGWSTTSSGSSKDYELGGAYAAEANGTLYPYWTPNAYSVVYELDGGTAGASAPASATFAAAFEVSKPTRKSYTFKGWTVGGANPDYTVARYGSSSSPSTTVTAETLCNNSSGSVYFKNLSSAAGGSVTLTANWELRTFTLTINPNGARYNDSTSTWVLQGTNLVYEGTALNQLDGTATNPDHPNLNYFVGYADTSSGGRLVYDANGRYVEGDYWTANGEFKGTSNLTVYEIWENRTAHNVTVKALPAEAGTVTVDYEGLHTNGTDISFGVIVDNSYTMTASAPNAGYSFVGWTNTLGVVTNANPWTYGANANVTNVAVYTGNVYKVTFAWWDEEMEGSITPKSRSYTFGSPFGVLPTATPDDRSFEFVGWCDEDENDVTAASIMQMSGNRNYLYAKVQKRTAYTVDYVCEQSHVGDMTNETFFCNEETALTSNAFRRTGYTFQGWAKSDDKTKVVYADGERVLNLVSANETATLYAVWSNNVYTVKFDKNGGGVGQMDPQTFTYDVAQALPPCGYAPPTGLDFLGWSNAVDNVMYNDQQVVSNLCTQAGETNTLKAIWGVKVSDYSLAMKCRNLKWAPEEYAEPADWDIVPDSGVKSVKSKTDFYLSATVLTSGTISFTWSSKSQPENVDLCLRTRAIDSSEWADLVITEIHFGEGEGAETKRVSLPQGADSLVVGFCMEGTADNSDVLIESVTWTPDPQQDAPVAATSVLVEDGTFKLKVAGVEGVTYGVWTNADLTVPVAKWGLMETKKGEGSALEFSLPIAPEMPQLFFRPFTVK